MARATLAFCCVVIACATATRADITTWTGNSGTGFTDAGNWTGIVPRDSDWYDTARFTNNAPGNKTPTLSSNRDVFSIQFDNSVGWTLGPSGRSLTLRKLSSTGSGTNTVTAKLKSMYSNYTWTIGAGNTLHLAGGLYQNTGGSIIKLTGGGTLRINGSIEGWSSTLQMHVEDATLRIDASVPYESGGAVHLTGPNAALQLNTSVAAAQAMIGADIINDTGQPLAVTDLGGGRVEIAVDPGDPMPPIAGNWSLTFEENFNGSKLDGSKWRLGEHHAGNNTSGALSPQSVAVANGVLKLTTRQGQTTFAGDTKNYAMGEVSTFFQFRQKYGYFEARIKYPAVQGLWPAFWLMPDRGEYGWDGNYYRSFVKFDLGNVNPGTINSAQLRLKVKAKETPSDPNQPQGQNVVFMRLEDDSWDEMSITWANQPTPDPVWIAQRWEDQIVVGQDVVVDVTDYVAQQMAGDKTISFVLADTYMRSRNISFHSREAASQGDRPRLVINGSTYYADEDAYVRWGDEDTNFGDAVTLRVKDAYDDTASTYNGGMEVDIMESLGVWGTNWTQHALHWNGYGSGHQTAHSGEIYYPGGPANDFHTYGLLWEDGGYRFFIDGQETWSWYNSRAMSVPAYLILSHQVGGWDGNTPGSQVDGKVMEVDWVRVWSGTPAIAPFARWPLNNNSNDAIGNIDATLHNDATYSTNAKEGSHALSLDGVDDYVMLSPRDGDNPLHYAFTQRSVSFWMKADTTSGTRVLFDEGAYNRGFAVRLSNNQVEAIARKSSSEAVTATSGFFNSTAWTHVAAVYDGGSLKLYLNGAEADSASAALGEIDAHIGDAGLGASVAGSAFNAHGDNSTGQYFDGLIDDARVYSAALTPQQVQDLANGP